MCELLIYSYVTSFGLLTLTVLKEGTLTHKKHFKQISVYGVRTE